MKRSTERILTTHVGSLARSDSLIPLLRLREQGQPYDREDLARLVRESVADVVRKQVEAGVDIITDGEQGKASFFGYIVERFSGFERKPAAPGKESRPRAAGREYLSFPDYYAWSERIAEPFGGRSGGRGQGGVDTCTGPVRYRGHEAVQKDIDNLKAAVRGQIYEDVFVPAIASSYVASTFTNEYYRTHEEYEQAVSDAIREEYKAIVDAGFILQIDDPRLISYYMMNPELSVEECRKWAAQFEAANPRHEHEYHVFERVKLPDGKILIPGVISHTTNLVEHPELVAERILRFAKIVGCENVIAGADCGFAASALRFNDTHPSVAWLKFAALAEGARLATRELWRG
jgi:5-methyltetrahydropteroyltriglutamate--homocysteine methyltransferase